MLYGTNIGLRSNIWFDVDFSVYGVRGGAHPQWPGRGWMKSEMSGNLSRPKHGDSRVIDTIANCSDRLRLNLTHADIIRRTWEGEWAE